jgi:dihydroorotase
MFPGEASKMLLKGGLVFFENAFSEKDVLIEKGKIKKVAAPGSLAAKKTETIDCSGLHVLPGVIDAHVHFRVPGAEKKEDWQSASRAALAGGITTVLDMPNNTPPTTSVEALESKRELVREQAMVNYGFHFGAALDNLDEIEKAASAGFAAVKLFMGASTGNLLVDDEAVMAKVFALAKKLDKPVCVHAEEEEIIRQNTNQAKNEMWTDPAPVLHSRVRSELAEVKALEKAFALQAEKGNRLHVLHLSTAKGLALVEQAKKSSPLVSCEVTPHHLFLYSFAWQQNPGLRELWNFGKMNPPLRSPGDEQALLKGLNAGAIDFVASDHAPHLKPEKEVAYWLAPSGVPGVETLLALLLDASGQGKLALERIPKITSENPAKVYGLKGKGLIKEGFDADLTLVDLSQEWDVKNEELETKCHWSPFQGLKLKGRVKKTLVNGNLAFDEGEFNQFPGKEVAYV